MDYIKCHISEEDYKKINKDVRSNIEILSVEPKDFDYSFDEIWQDLKSKSSKAYKAVKKKKRVRIKKPIIADCNG